MVTAISKRNFLLRQDYIAGNRKKDVIAKRGEKLQLSEHDAIKFWGALHFDEKTQKSLIAFSKSNKIKRDV